MRRLRERFTYANVVSTLALFLVLGTGTAYATHLIVRSSDVVDESLVSADLKNGAAVKGADVINDSLEGADIKEGTLDLPSPGRVLLNGRINTQDEGGVGEGECRWGGVVESGAVHSADGDGVIPLVGLTNVLPAGSWTFGIECTDRLGFEFYTHAWITAVAISPT